MKCETRNLLIKNEIDEKRRFVEIPDTKKYKTLQICRIITDLNTIVNDFVKN